MAPPSATPGAGSPCPSIMQHVSRQMSGSFHRSYSSDILAPFAQRAFHVWRELRIALRRDGVASKVCAPEKLTFQIFLVELLQICLRWCSLAPSIPFSQAIAPVQLDLGLEFLHLDFHRPFARERGQGNWERIQFKRVVWPFARRQDPEISVRHLDGASSEFQ